ncbi:MAG TPA: hypothetical protein VMV48_14305 [Gallionellaceae bacterium]|nr:hypothetical protein [Gallionellaceae bacterium]
MHSFTIRHCLFNARLKVAGALLGAALLLPAQAAAAPAAAPAVPSTFGVTIGPALLCVDHIDPFYFWSYMNQFFGPPYKREGGAYWFKVQATLWGATLTDVMVSDGENQQVFVAASFKASPAKLSIAIQNSTGFSHKAEMPFLYSPLVSAMGSKIVYFDQSSKIYCSKYNLDYNRRHLPR